MAAARLNIPALVLYGGSIAPGQFEGHAVTIQDVYEAIGSHARGGMSDARFTALESAACPGAGACGGQFTANTMALVAEFLGIAPMGLSGVPATNPAKHNAGHRAGELVMDLLRKDVTPSKIITKSGDRKRHYGRRGHRRFDKFRAALAGDCQRGAHSSFD